MRRFLVALFLLGSLGAAQADDTASCAQFAWPLDTEKAWFASPDLRKAPNGDTIPVLTEGAVLFQLVDLATARLPKPPERAPKPPALKAGFLSFTALPKIGTLQVTLTGEGWIDMIQGDAYLQAKEHTGKQGCPGLRKSVRFEVKQESLILQISGVDRPTIGIAFRFVD